MLKFNKHAWIKILNEWRNRFFHGYYEKCALNHIFTFSVILFEVLKIYTILSAIAYYLLLPLIYALSLLPFRVLYLVADTVYVLLYYVLGYRKKVVLANLRNSFPEKSEKEIHRICKDFYHYLCDLFLETFKTLTISKTAMVKHCSFTPATVDLFKRLAAEKKSVVLVMGHKGNWEWAGNTFSIMCPQQLYVIYHPLANKHFNGLMYSMRTRFGTKLIAMQDTFRDMVQNRHEVNATAFIADQSPQPKTAQWLTFLHQDTPVFKGTEKIAQKMNYPVVYVTVIREKRGYYTVSAQILTATPADEKEGAITIAHTRKLEEDIVAQPSTWLWSHKRWKHKRAAVTTEL
ncbi:KDO2-lipid IV(A) lauroyltransferase [Chitinophaga polysaccharea]|uniref:KDO2-lipid IV(A) lauroyltransferase n=1 Tax=Chitinophaga polysaccharea TaxID=1293035 RepID=A0A561P6A7_9BACT|nr:KDO2-lipid IV(A) lauroyltransferase [Chitinophaga polysaccharea]